jgi:hypothetical protein
MSEAASAEGKTEDLAPGRVEEEEEEEEEQEEPSQEEEEGEEGEGDDSPWAQQGYTPFDSAAG